MKLLSIILSISMSILFLFVGQYNSLFMIALLATHILISVHLYRPYRFLAAIYTTLWILIYAFYNLDAIINSLSTAADKEIDVTTIQILFLIGVFVFALKLFTPGKGYFVLGSLAGFWIALIYILVSNYDKGNFAKHLLETIKLNSVEYIYSDLWWLTLIFAFLFYMAKAFGEDDMEERVDKRESNDSFKRIKRKKSPSRINQTKLNHSIKELDSLIGLTEVKEFITELTHDVSTHKDRMRRGQKISNMSYHMIYLGPPGTGKTTVARIVGDILNSLGVLSKGHLIEATREDLVGEYVGQTAPKTRKVIEKAIGGVLFIDEAYSLARGQDSKDYGREAIDTLVKCMEEYRNDLVVILAGYPKEMNHFLKANSGLDSRFPMKIQFSNYSEEELLEIGKRMLISQNFSLMEDTEKALFYAINQRNIKDDENSGNGRLVRNIIEEAIRKQSRRLKETGDRENFYQLIPEDFGFNQERFSIDDELKKVIGHDELKELVQKFIAQVKIQKMRHEKGLKYALNHSYHMIFLGNPGTGKTMMARIMASILKELKVLKKGQLIEVDRGDLVAVGSTAERTKEKIKEALGGILFIDEAYSLSRDLAGLEAIDTLVKAMEDYRENLVVILAGYKDEMGKFLETNPGLSSRFPNIFPFKDYNEMELMQIFDQLLEEYEYKVSVEVKQDIILPLISKGVKNKEGNGRFIRNLFEAAQRNQAIRLERQTQIVDEDLITFVSDDFRSILEETNDLSRI